MEPFLGEAPVDLSNGGWGSVEQRPCITDTRISKKARPELNVNVNIMCSE